MLIDSIYFYTKFKILILLIFLNGNPEIQQPKGKFGLLNTLWTGDADLRLYITTVQDG